MVVFDKMTQRNLCRNTQGYVKSRKLYDIAESHLKRISFIIYLQHPLLLMLLTFFVILQIVSLMH